MKCPRCRLIVTDRLPKCQGCGFSIRDLDRRLRRMPERTGFVNDFAKLLSTEEKTPIEDRLSQFYRACGGEIVLVTVNSTKPVKPSEYVFWLFNRWGVGGETHAGLLILLAWKERRIECEVGYSWEAIISDVESGEMLDGDVVPLLKAGKIAEALEKGVELVVRLLTHTIPMGSKDYYKILQVDPSAEPEVIASVYKRLAQKYHPDKNKSPSATRRMQEINEAYEVLSDPVKRAQYDSGNGI